MEQTLTAKMRLAVTADEERILLSTMNAYLAACNKVSEYIFKTHDLRQKSLHAALYHLLRSEFGLRSQMAQSAIHSVIASYKMILSNKQSWTRVTYRHGFYDLVWNRDYSLREDRFSINTLEGRLSLRFCVAGYEHVFDGESRFGSAKVVRKHGHFYICVRYTRDVPDVTAITNVVGVDRGINFLAVSYDSKGKTKFWNGRECKQKRAKYKRVRQELQKRGTSSARRRLRQIGSRENRWMSDVNHQVSKALVEQNPAGTLFVLESLMGIRHALERVHRHGRYVQVSWAYFDLGRKITYKAVRAGCKVIEVDPRYTSQMCPKCGFVDKHNRDKKQHVFTCQCCGYRSNDDRIAAMNLQAKGIQYHAAVTGEQACL